MQDADNQLRAHEEDAVLAVLTRESVLYKLEYKEQQAQFLQASLAGITDRHPSLICRLRYAPSAILSNAFARSAASPAPFEAR